MKNQEIKEEDLQRILAHYTTFDERLRAAAIHAEISRRLTDSALHMNQPETPDCWKNHPRASKGGAK